MRPLPPRTTTSLRLLRQPGQKWLTFLLLQWKEKEEKGELLSTPPPPPQSLWAGREEEEEEGRRGGRGLSPKGTQFKGGKGSGVPFLSREREQRRRRRTEKGPFFPSLSLPFSFLFCAVCVCCNVRQKGGRGRRRPKKTSREFPGNNIRGKVFSLFLPARR